jgi:hypothetical protein
MPYKTPTRLRNAAYNAQQGRCCYCSKPMWLENIAAFAKTHKYSLAQARWLQCTAEHLHARANGGADSAGNVAAACLFCNMKRHRRKDPLPPEQYRHYVAKRITKGAWHCLK